ncbi:MAG: SDR family NAD(P)-dependent oxidoreductase [Candidatus Thiodiazotropha sp.]
MSLNPRLDNWQGRRIWIIGASSGIGAALVSRLQQHGARLALSARREDALQAIAQADDQVLPLDVTDEEAMIQVHRQLIDEWGGIDLVIYSAGTYAPMRSWDMDLAQVEQAMRINLGGVYTLISRVVPHFLMRGSGGICLVASVAGYTGLPKALAYGPFKAALINLAQILYADLAPKGIGVYLVNPGFVETRLTEQNDFHMPALISADEAALEILKGLSKGRFEIDFPRRFSWWLKRLSRLPDSLRLSLMTRVARS